MLLKDKPNRLAQLITDGTIACTLFEIIILNNLDINIFFNIIHDIQKRDSVLTTKNYQSNSIPYYEA